MDKSRIDEADPASDRPVETRSPDDVSPSLPRWLQLLAGGVVGITALLCAFLSAGAAWAPASAVSPQTVVAAVAALAASAWLLVLATRLIGNRRVVGGLMGPRALRCVAVGFLLLPIVGLFTGYYREGGVLAILQAGILVAAAHGVWSLAKARSSTG